MTIAAIQNSTLVTVTEGGASKPPQRDKELDEKITSFACEVLRVYHGLDEFHHLYRGSKISEFSMNRHGNDPCFEKMQRGFNSLKERAKDLKKSATGIAKLFNLMVSDVCQKKFGKKALPSIELMVHDLIGKDKIIPNHSFLKQGVVCIKDDFAPALKPENLITESELTLMESLMKGLFNTKNGVIEIKGDEDFITHVKNDIEKLITFPEGRILAEKLIEKKTKLKIIKSDNNGYCDLNTIILNNIPNLVFGHSKTDIVRIWTPSYIALVHEWIHAIHYLYKDASDDLASENPKLWANQEEINTIGGPKSTSTLGITENDVRKRTFQPQRNYHVAPPELFHWNYTLNQKIEEYILFDQVDDLISIIKQNPRIKREPMREVVEYTHISKWHSDLIHAVLNTESGEFIFSRQKESEAIFLKAVLNNDTEVVKRLLSMFSDQCEAIPIDTLSKITASSFKRGNLDLTNLLIGIKFDPKVIQDLLTPDELIEFCSKATMAAEIREYLLSNTTLN